MEAEIKYFAERQKAAEDNDEPTLVRACAKRIEELGRLGLTLDEREEIHNRRM